MIAPSEFQRYLQSILNVSREDIQREVRDRFIPTLAELPLQVQSCTSSKADSQEQQKERREQFAVLEGLRKYAPEHVLLVGKPGSGKSTSLRRLLWEEAGRCLEAIEQGNSEIPPIPILIELRSLCGSLLSAIQEKLEWWLDLDEKTLKALLRDRRLLVLLDGLNELPNEKAWLAVDQFRQVCADLKVPLIITTRELGSGLVQGIAKKLEILPLTEPQIREFVQKRLPEMGGELLRQIQGWLRELAETPLLLKLLCDVFEQNGEIPKSRGDLFRREFARRYEEFKPERLRNVSEDSRRFACDLLKDLAFTMVKGEPHTDPCKPSVSWITISRTDAEKILATSLAGDRTPDVAVMAKAKEWLEDLLEWHLLQVASDRDRIEFHHQLFQEYYAGEWLLPKLAELSDEELKYYYLNYLKWTEPLAMAMTFVESEALAVGVVRLALEVDLMLGARFAGEVNSRLHKQTVRLVKVLRLPINVKIKLLGATHSDEIVNLLRKKLVDKDIGIRWAVVDALGNVKNEAAVMLLTEALNNSDSRIRNKVVAELGGTNSEIAVIALTNIFKNDESPDVCWQAIASLGKIGRKSAVIVLIEALEDCYSSRIRAKALLELRKLGEEVPIEKILNLLEDSDAALRLNAAYEIEYMKNSSEIKALIEERGIDIFPVLTPEDHMSSTSELVARLVNDFREIDTTPLVDLLNHDNWEVCCGAATALGELRDESAISALSQVLNDEDKCMVWPNAATALGKIGTKAALLALVDYLETENSELRRYVIDALGETRNNLFSEFLALKLGIDDDQYVRCSAAIGLGKIGGELAVKALTKKILFDETPMVERIAAEQLGQVARYEDIFYLRNLTYFSENTVFFEAIKTIQSRCQFYNYEIAQSSPPEMLDANGNLQNELSRGILNMTNNFNFDQRGASIGVNVANEGSNIKFIQHARQSINISEQDLAEAAQKIQALLNQLAQTYPPTNEPQQQTLIQKFLERIESTPELIKVVLAGGIEGLKILCPPAGIPVEMARRLYEVVQERHSKP